MSAPAEHWQILSDSFEQLRRRISKATTKNINSRELKDLARAVSQMYFRKTREEIVAIDLGDDLTILDSGFQTLLALSDGNNAKASYIKQLSTLRKLFPIVAGRIELGFGSSRQAASINEEDLKIAAVLDGLVPAAALSYRQAVTDLTDDKRVSFRGPALELREALRETLDHLAPDKDVMAAEWYVQEKNRNGPTMKQKVRFIMRARGQNKSGASPPEQAATTIEEIIGGFARSVYELSSIGTHVALERAAVLRIRRYVAVVLHDILEL